MLIINRIKGQSIIIGENLRVTLLDIQGKQIKLGFEDLNEISILPVCTLGWNERMQIGKDQTILVVKIWGKQVKLGVDVPMDIRIQRGELYEKDKSV